MRMMSGARSEKIRGALVSGRDRHFARFHTTSSTVPIIEVGLVYLSSSAVSELTMRFCVPPARLGKDAPSMFVVIVFVASSTDQVPKFAVMPCSAALFSSAVLWFRLLEANFGTSDRKIINAYRPSASNMTRPLGFGPQRS